MFPLLILAASVSTPSCWDIFDSALRRSASSMHPAYVSYDERILVTQDDQRLVQSIAHIDYRDDGISRVRDERFNFEPIITRHAEPGPPELGPYGANRDSWLPQAEVLPTIARVRSQGDLQCHFNNVVTYKGHTTYRLDFSGVTNRPSVKSVWVDTTSKTIWKVIVSGYVHFGDDTERQPPLTDFEVELSYAGPYLVVNHVVWQYRRHEFSQISKYFGEYTLAGYTFPDVLPDAYFASTAAFVSP